MPPKKKSRVISTADTYVALDALNLCSNQFSRGAVEALRICHAQFLARMTSELALLGDEDEPFTIQPNHVDECLEKLGFADYSETLRIANRNQKAPARRNTKKRKQWSADMEAEQERLLAQSKETAQQQQKKQS